mmetsp:Transcript_3960/g.5262  ORF Transcript_3960/g.5262 Transcript_3960/m.5262 type:complete len:82 (-) Transcript_3960:68-313(-)
MVLACGHIFNLAHLEVAFATLAYGSKLVSIAQLVGARAMDTIATVASGVDVTRSGESNGEVLTAADLNNTAGCLERDRSHG